MQEHAGQPGVPIPDLKEYQQLWKEFRKGVAVRSKPKCTLCGEVFESRKLLLAHKLASHEDSVKLSFLSFYLEKASVPCGVSLDGAVSGRGAVVLECPCCAAERQ